MARSATEEFEAFRFLVLCEERLRANKDDVDALFTKAVALASVGRLDESIQVLDDVARRSPDYPGLWRLKSVVFRKLGNTQMSLLCAERNGDLLP